MIFVWLILFITFLVCGSILIPRETIQRYKNAPKDWQYWTAHLLFYSIPISALFADGNSSPPAILTGMLSFAGGGAFYIWAIRSNPYFLPNIQVPVKIVSGGAYSICAHPGYASMMLLAAGSWLMIGHRLAIIPLAAYGALMVWRARKENSLIYQ
jgi:protein-S-isoprenylcysteine O-methyltransferase Ste14